jgi:hypothetical protein
MSAEGCARGESWSYTFLTGNIAAFAASIVLRDTAPPFHESDVPDERNNAIERRIDSEG